MPYLIDGHNLIPNVAGIQLTDPDDETRLVSLLQDFCRERRKTVEVFFDRAPAGQAGTRRFGRVRAQYVREGMTADDAIMGRLAQLGKKARNYTVVSSDRQVQQAARAVHAQVLSSQAFAKGLRSLESPGSGDDGRGRLLSPEEVTAWEELFRRGHPPSEDRE
jgi:uncharacterized protein